MSIKRVLGLVLSLLMVLAIVPAAALAEEVGSAVNERALLKLLDDAWVVLDKVEDEAIASGAEMSEVTYAVYKAALQLDLVDEKSINSVTAKSFFFKVNGMECCYDYVARNVKHSSAIGEDTLAAVTETAAKVVNTKNGPTSMNVLLVGPYYGHDGSFTDQYRNEANSIAAATGGTMTELASSAATGPAIAEAYPDCGVVIYDSHGTASGTSSYLCLTTNAGITSTDYSNGWAVSSGSAAYIDGRYIQNHITSELPNTLVWMAICEGMKLSGRGTTGYALLDAGAGCVYGYSQSVTFAGDYLYEATFWNEMKNNNATVAEAFDVMIATHGEPDPHGDAWAIVMSPDDPFPTNPDSHQNVNCDWQLFGGSLEPVELQSYSLSETAVEVYRTASVNVTFNRIPDNANNYELTWGTENASIATVNGNNRRVTITGVGDGTTRIYCDVVADGVNMGRAYCDVNVLHFPDLNEAANAENGDLTFTSATANYPWSVAIVDGRAAAKSGNGGSASTTSTMQLQLQMQAGESISFDWKVSSEYNYDKLGFYVNNSQQGSLISGSTDWATITYTAPSTGTYTFQWRYTKDVSVNSGDDCGYVDNVVYNRAYTPGDVDNNGIVDSVDALIILRSTMDLVTLTSSQTLAADYNGDGVVNSLDAIAILRDSMNIG
ncbi:MAG: Ig-like domain-containing protein [Clostridia bacterium]|nr:Ig-like domain-containing protein [Clostridia bacterium]